MQHMNPVTDVQPNLRVTRPANASRRLLPLADVLRIVGVSKSTWWAGVKAGIYPQPVHPTPGRSVWPSDRIDELVERICAGDLNQSNEVA